MFSQKNLVSRAQFPTESHVAYVQEIISLCKKVDPAMAEEAKVGHILKGNTDDAFQLLVMRNCSTVEEVIAECCRFQQAKSRRISRTLTRLPNTPLTSTCEGAHNMVPSATYDVVKIVRQELEAMTSASKYTHLPDDFDTALVSMVQTVIRNELASLELCQQRQQPCSMLYDPTQASHVILQYGEHQTTARFVSIAKPSYTELAIATNAGVANDTFSFRRTPRGW